MKSLFNKMANITRPIKNTTDLEKVFICPNYATDTLINGNMSECINYLKDLIKTGIAGQLIAHEELTNIKEQVQDRYEYIKDKVFAP